MRASRCSVVLLLTVLACSSGEIRGGGVGGAAGNGSSGGSGAVSGGASAGGSSGGAGAPAGGGSGVGADGSGGAAAGSGGSAGTGGGVTSGTPLIDRISVSEVTVPAGVKEGVDNWRIWGTDALHVAPVFTSPMAGCETLVCFTTDSGGTLTARAAHLDADDALVTVLDLGSGLECRGIAAGPAGEFAALLWDDAADRIYVRSFDLSGAAGFDTELVNDDNVPDDFGIGESRFEFGDGRYGAYYHVHSDSGHEGDTLKWVDAATGQEDTEWPWGCSHSMSNVLRYHPTLDEFVSGCVTDCYPGTGDGEFEDVSIGGVYLNGGEAKIMDVAAGCNGDVAGELGSLALSPDGFKVVFNAHQAPATLGQQSYDPDSMNQDIAFASISGQLSSGGVIWLTSTASVNEADSSIAPFSPADDDAEQYVVGWSEAGDTTTYELGRVDPAGAFLEGPVDVSAVAGWGRRDDPFRTHANGDVIWAWFDAPGSSTLRVARVLSGAACE